MSTSKIVKALSLLIVTYAAYLGGASVARDRVASGPTPESEGWLWAENFNYQHSCMTDEIRSVFQDIHVRMKKDARDLRDAIWGDKADQADNPNLNILRISFIVSSSKPNTPAKIVETKLFSDHVFLSGTATPKTSRKFSCITSYVFSASELKTDEAYTKTPQKKAFIYPPLEDFSTGKIIERVQNRYRAADQTRLPKIAELAMRYQNLSHDDLMTWYSDANQSAEHFQGGQAKENDTPVFFKHLQDSEQKVIYYLDHITEWMALYPSLKNNLSFFQRLESTIDHLITFFSSKKVYVARQVRAYIDSLPQEEDEEKEESTTTCEKDLGSAIGRVKDYIEKRKKYPTNSLDRHYLSVMARCAEQLAECSQYLSSETLLKRDLTTARIKALQDAQQPQEITIMSEIAQMGSLLNHAAPKTASLKAAMIEWKDWIAQALNISCSTPENEDEIENALGELRRLLITIRTDSRVKKYGADPFPQEFMAAVKASMDSANGDFISGIILHIHSTNDVCYTCAPDLAQESMLRAGFAGRFCEFVQEMNLNKQPVSFQIINACDFLRPCRQYTRARIEQLPKLFQPLQSREIRFYQHWFETGRKHELALKDVKEFKVPQMQAQPYLEDDDEASVMEDEGQKSVEGGASSSTQGQRAPDSLAQKKDDADADIDDKAKKIPEDAGDQSPFDLDALGEYH